MLFIELAAQAVRGFTPSVRVALRPGYVALKSPTNVPAPLSGLVMALCFPDGRGGDLVYLAPGAKAGRAGLSIQGRGQTLWRVVRDLGGAGGLHRLNPRTNQYEVVTQDAGELAQLVRTEVGLPNRTTLEHVFSFNGAQLPSRRPMQAKGAAVALPKVSPSRAPDVVEAERRLEGLEKELVTAKTAQEMQFRLDGIQAELFVAESKLKEYGELKAKVVAAREELARAPTPKSLGLPDDILQRVQRFDDEKKRRDESLAKLAAERESAIDASAFTVAPLHHDRRFWLSLAVGVGFLVLGASLEGGARAVALLAIPAFTAAMLLALRFVEDLQGQSREEAKADVFSQREKKIHDEFQLSTTMVKAAYDKTGVMTPDEFAAVMAKCEELAPALMELELQLADFDSEPANQDLEPHVAQMKAELEELNGKLLGLSGGYVREVREIEREIKEVRDILLPAPVTQDFKPISTAPAETFEDPIPAVMQLGAELFNTDVTTLWAVLKDRATQYLKALTDQRYHGVDVVAEGRSKVLAPGRVIPAGELPARDIDLLYLGIRLTQVEKYSAQEKIPVIIEDSFGSVIEGTKQSLVGRMLKHIGSLTQVLHVTGAGQNVSAADAIVQL